MSLKEQVLKQVLALPPQKVRHKLDLLSEVIQVVALKGMESGGVFQKCSFIGGTCLRLIHDIKRYSEDLDFEALQPGIEAESFKLWMRHAVDSLKKEGFAGASVSVPSSIEEKKVFKAFLKVPGIQKEAGLSPMASQVVTAKVELGINPVSQACAVGGMMTRFGFSYPITHHDLPSLMGGKVAALLCREWTKGRDWYDWVWYRSQEPAIEPNLPYLTSAVLSSNPSVAIESDGTNWPQLLREKALALDADEVLEDVGPFLENYQEQSAWLTREHFLSLVPSAVDLTGEVSTETVRFRS